MHTFSTKNDNFLITFNNCSIRKVSESKTAKDVEFVLLNVCRRSAFNRNLTPGYIYNMLRNNMITLSLIIFSVSIHVSTRIT